MNHVVKTFYNNTSVAIIVFSVDSTESLKSVEKYLQDVQQFCPEDTIKILVASKCDKKERHFKKEDI